MNVIRTTPPRPVDVTAVFPRLTPLARTAIRLHPRPGTPTPHDSSVGGPLLWPADEPWPHCDGPHDWVDQSHEGPNAMLPVVQLYVRDAPLLRPPGQADLLQVLWCPCEHPPDNKPPTVLFWRSSAEVADLLATPPEPSVTEYDDSYLPKPCVLAPERITEYPNPLDLSEELRQQLADRDRWQAAGVAVDASHEITPQDYYRNELALAPGWKVGGWPPWGRTDPMTRFCVACGAGMTPLLTVASYEWNADHHGWIPYEDQALAAPGNVNVNNPPRVHVGSTDHLQIYVCPESPDHPHTDLIQ